MMFQRNNASTRRNKIPETRKFQSEIFVGRTRTGERVYDPHNVAGGLRKCGAIADVTRALRSLFLGHEERLIVEIPDGPRMREGRRFLPPRYEPTDEQLLSNEPLPGPPTTAHRFRVVREARRTAILLPA